MPVIRLLTAVVGGAVEGAAGDELEVDKATAKVWADGVRAELVVPPAKGAKAVNDSPEPAELAEPAEPAEIKTPRDTRPPMTGERAVAPPAGEQR